MLTLFFQASWDYFKLEEARTSVQSPWDREQRFIQTNWEATADSESESPMFCHGVVVLTTWASFESLW